MPDEHPALVAAGGEHPEYEALEDEVRLLGEDLPVLEGPGLGLVRVADRVLRRGLLLGDQLPLRAGREAGAAHAAQPGLLQLGDQLGGVELTGERRAQDAVVAGVDVVGVVRPLRLAAPDLDFVARGGGCAITASYAGDLAELGVGIGAQLLDALVRAVQPARQVVAAGDLARRRRRGAEVRVERDQALELVQRAAALARQLYELLARQPAVLALDLVQVWDQAGPGKAPGAGLGARCARDRHAAGSAATGSTRTAQNLNSGIFPCGSISSIVSTLAAASRKWNGMKQVPGVSR